MKGEALTRLHARAAELAVSRALGRGALDAAQAEAASLLLDRAPVLVLDPRQARRRRYSPRRPSSIQAWRAHPRLS